MRDRRTGTPAGNCPALQSESRTSCPAGERPILDRLREIADKPVTTIINTDQHAYTNSITSTATSSSRHGGRRPREDREADAGDASGDRRPPAEEHAAD